MLSCEPRKAWTVVQLTGISAYWKFALCYFVFIRISITTCFQNQKNQKRIFTFTKKKKKQKVKIVLSICFGMSSYRGKVVLMVKNLPACRRPKRCRFDPWVGKILCRRKWQPTPIFLAGKSQTEEPSGLQSMGSQRVSHVWAHTHTVTEAVSTSSTECHQALSLGTTFSISASTVAVSICAYLNHLCIY